MSPVPEVRILVVEDDPVFLQILQKRLVSEGYRVATAVDGREGMKAIVTFEPHLVISDWMMPHVDGLELCQSIKTGLKDTAPYFILLTAKGEVSDRMLALETGADDYLVKPCDHAELLTHVRTGLRIVLLGQELRENAHDLLRARAELAKAHEDQSRLRELLHVCPHCGRVRTPEGAWEELDVLLESGPVHDVRDPCPDCALGGFGNAEAA